MLIGNKKGNIIKKNKIHIYILCMQIIKVKHWDKIKKSNINTIYWFKTFLKHT